MNYTKIIKFDSNCSPASIGRSIITNLQNAGVKIEGGGSNIDFFGMKCPMGYAKINGRVSIENTERGTIVKITATKVDATFRCVLVMFAGLLLFIIGFLIGLILFVVDKNSSQKLIDTLASNIKESVL